MGCGLRQYMGCRRSRREVEESVGFFIFSMREEIEKLLFVV